jgi:hypothetical protein
VVERRAVFVRMVRERIDGARLLGHACSSAPEAAPLGFLDAAGASPN